MTNEDHAPALTAAEYVLDRRKLEVIYAVRALDKARAALRVAEDALLVERGFLRGVNGFWMHPECSRGSLYRDDALIHCECHRKP